MTLQTSGRNSTIKMDQKRVDSENQAKSILYLIRNKPEIDSILAAFNKSIDLTQEDPGNPIQEDPRTACVTEQGREFAIKGLERAILIFQLLDRQVYDNGSTMRDNCKTKFKKQLEFVDGQIENIKKEGLDSWTTDKIIELESILNTSNIFCAPDTTTPSDVVSFFLYYHFFLTFVFLLTLKLM